MIEILDCTLRDGGYVNNWEFDAESSKAIVEGLYEAGVKWIEIGILGKDGKSGLQTKFSCFKDMEKLLVDRKSDCHYSVMVTTSSSKSFEYPECTSITPDVMRIAFFKSEVQETMKLAMDLKAKGYTVFLQPMATFMYTEGELELLICAVNDLKPFAMYMVDSFSTLYPMDVAHMRDCILKGLDEDIALGFHAHNNIQMAFANVCEFVSKETSQRLFVDGSIFGMGRGAGNVPLELLMHMFNQKYNRSFDVSKVLTLYERYLVDIYKKYGWGYTMPYFLTAVNATNSAWAWFFMSKGIDSLPDLEKALKMVPSKWTYTLKSDIGEEIVKIIQGEK